MRSIRIEIKVQAQMLERIDKAARTDFASRSGYIREAIAMRLHREHREPDPTPGDIIELLKRS
jgi:metal-responsive CopG/Arc/MetJ family transcriptional regulator